METIQARVSKQLLAKASRLFTGTLDGRIIEILQNARRAGASEVLITSEDGKVTVVESTRIKRQEVAIVETANEGRIGVRCAPRKDEVAIALGRTHESR